MDDPRLPVDDPRVDEALREQHALANRVVVVDGSRPAPRTAVGLDVSYEVGTDRVVAAAVLVDIASGSILAEVTKDGVADFPYVPGLLAFREVPILRAVLDDLDQTPELLVCDGQGIAHPRGCGLASHLGVVVGLPAIGCAKSRYVGEHDEPGPRRGDGADLLLGERVVGTVLRTQDRVKPIYVSPGHLVGVAEAAALALALTGRYRLPDPIRHADQLSRRRLRRS